MGGNSIHRFRNTSVLAVCAIDAPVVVTSDEMDDRLAEVYARVGLRPGMMQRLAGIHERRWWNRGTTFADGAAMAGAKAMAEAGVQPGDIGLMVNTSVSRAHLEPSTAVAVHHALGLPSSCQNFDVTNACLGFVNGMQLAAAMLESGQIDYALVVNGEDARGIHNATISRLQNGSGDAKDVFAQFASLTLGSGAAAMVLGRSDKHPEGHRFLGGATRAGSEHHLLCVGRHGLHAHRQHRADERRAGAVPRAVGGIRGRLRLARAASSRYVMHQVSTVHTRAISSGAGHRPGTGPADLPAARQPGAGGHPVHPRRHRRRALAGRPGAADGHRLRSERLDLRDSSGDGDRSSVPPARAGSTVHPALPPSGSPDWMPRWSRLVHSSTPTG